MRSGCCVSGRRGDELMSVDMLLLDTNVSSVLEFSGGLEDFLFRISGSLEIYFPLSIRICIEH